MRPGRDLLACYQRTVHQAREELQKSELLRFWSALQLHKIREQRQKFMLRNHLFSITATSPIARWPSKH